MRVIKKKKKKKKKKGKRERAYGCVYVCRCVCAALNRNCFTFFLEVDKNRETSKESVILEKKKKRKKKKNDFSNHTLRRILSWAHRHSHIPADT